MADSLQFSGLRAALDALASRATDPKFGSLKPDLWWDHIETALNESLTLPDGVLNAADYGTGKTDVEIKAAIEAAQALTLPGGGFERALILIPAGEWLLSSTPQVYQSGVRVRAMPGAVIKRAPGAVIPALFKFQGGGSPPYDETIHDVGLSGGIWDGDGNGADWGLSVPFGADTNGIGIIFGFCEDFFCHDVTIQNTRNTGLLLGAGKDIPAARGFVRDIRITGVGNAADTALTVDPDGLGTSGLTYSTVENVIIRDCREAHHGGPGENNLAGSSGWTTFDTVAYNRFSNICIDGTTTSGLGIDASGGDGEVAYNVFENITINDTVASGIRVYANNTSFPNKVHHNTFSNVVITNVAGSHPKAGNEDDNGIDFSANADDLIYDNSFDVNISACAGAPVEFSRIKRCVIKGIESDNGSAVSDEQGASSSTSDDNVIDLVGTSTAVIAIAVSSNVLKFPKYRSEQAFFTCDSTGTTITSAPNNAYTGVPVYVRMTNASPSTFPNGASMVTATGGTLSPAQNQLVRLIYDGSVTLASLVI